MRTIGIVGLGRMGGNMARRLIDDDYEIVGFDASDTALADAAEDGVRTVSSASAVARQTDVVITSLPNPETVADVYCDEDGIIAGRPDIAIEMSTIDPDTTDAVAAVAAEADVRVIDAPVSGGPESSRAGALSVMVGAEQDDLPGEVQALFEALGKDVYYLGGVGDGHTVKLLNNMLSMGNMMLAMEAMALGAARGVDLAAVFEVISNSGGSSNQFEKRATRVLNRNFEPGFTVDFGKKDLGLALETAAATDFPLVATSLIHELFTEATAIGLGGEDMCAVVKLFERYTDAAVESPVEMDESYAGY